VVTTAAMNEADKSAWCRSHGAYPEELAKWCASASTALAAPEELRASPQATCTDRKCIKELERELLRKDRAQIEDAGDASHGWGRAYAVRVMPGRGPGEAGMVGEARGRSQVNSVWA